MTKKISIWLLVTFILAITHLAEAQQPKRIPRIGILNSGSRSSDATNRDAFREGMRELGYVEGKNIVFESETPMAISSPG